MENFINVGLNDLQDFKTEVVAAVWFMRIGDGQNCINKLRIIKEEKTDSKAPSAVFHSMFYYEVL